MNLIQKVRVIFKVIQRGQRKAGIDSRKRGFRKIPDAIFILKLPYSFFIQKIGPVSAYKIKNFCVSRTVRI